MTCTAARQSQRNHRLNTAVRHTKSPSATASAQAPTDSKSNATHAKRLARVATAVALTLPTLARLAVAGVYGVRVAPGGA